MAEAFQTNDAGYIVHALGVVARAKGVTQIAMPTGLSREQLWACAIISSARRICLVSVFVTFDTAKCTSYFCAGPLSLFQ